MTEPRFRIDELARLGQQAAVSVIAVAGRTVAARIVQFAGTIALARILGTSQFGFLAFGLTVLVLATFLSDVGVGAALIRRPTDASLPELETLLALQFSATVLIIVIAFVVAATSFGSTGVACVVMISGLPLVAARAPAIVVLERRLSFRPIAYAEVADQVVFYGLGVGLAAGGLGLWGVACAGIVRPLVGTFVVTRAAGLGRLRPRFSLEQARGLLRFGTRYQAATLATVCRDQGLNVGVAAIAGSATLGIWSLATRVMQVPFLLFSSLWRVSFPAVTRLVASGGDARHIASRLAEAVAILSGILMIPLVALAPAAIPALLGAQWDPAVKVVLPAAIGLSLSGPISVASAGVLYALGDATSPLVAVSVGATVWATVGLSLLMPFGVAALGIAWLLGCLAEASCFAYAMRRATNLNVIRATGAAPWMAMVIGSLAWGASRLLGLHLGPSAGVAFAAEAAYVLSVVVAHPAAVKMIWRLPAQMSRKAELART